MNTERLTADEVQNLLQNLQTLMKVSRACKNLILGDCTSNNSNLSASTRAHQFPEANKQFPTPSISSGDIRKRKIPASKQLSSKKICHDESVRQNLYR